MTKQKTLRGTERIRLLNELEERYGKTTNSRQSFFYWRKKYAWLLVVTGAKAVKRIMDILIAGFMLVLLSPLFLIVAILIKWQDGGPILYVADRVGKWGQLFKFPKFRSMTVNAETIKESLTNENIDKKGKHFKMKQDPRVTPLGQFLRKTSIDELPQLWCVLVGKMSLVGPRPPLPKEVEKYNLNERRRLEITPGITGMWQVSGRSEIPFEKQVKLDVEYIESRSVWGDFVILLKTIPAVIFGRGAY
jgi:lipopolysaccharide/colanic/teichoic acid biosynthesis glycosyltransferase